MTELASYISFLSMIFMYISLATILHSDSINNLQQREDREKHETSLQNIASECYSIVKERDQLLDKSNKFQAQMRRLRNHQFRCGKNADSRSVDAAVNGNVESLDMDDLTKSIWAGALINNQSKPKQVSMESIARSLSPICLSCLNHFALLLWQHSSGNKSIRPCNQEPRTLPKKETRGIECSDSDT